MARRKKLPAIKVGELGGITAGQALTREPGVCVLRIDGWHPARLNQWDGRHWTVRAKAKEFDRDVVAFEAFRQETPEARGRRRVGLTVVLAPRQRKCDPDAYWKSLLDALVKVGLLVDDSDRWCELTPVRYERGKAKASVITLEDLAYEPA